VRTVQGQTSQVGLFCREGAHVCGTAERQPVFCERQVVAYDAHFAVRTGLGMSQQGEGTVVPVQLKGWWASIVPEPASRSSGRRHSGCLPPLRVGLI
jgi:hypothetical protein